MADIFLEWGGDLLLDSYGGIALAYGWDEVRQFIERVVLTNANYQLPDGRIVPAEYLFHPEFGLTTRELIGQLRQQQVLNTIERKITQAVAANPAIAKTPAPVIAIVPIQPAGIQIYVDVFMANGTPGTVALEVTP